MIELLKNSKCSNHSENDVVAICLDISCWSIGKKPFYCINCLQDHDINNHKIIESSIAFGDQLDITIDNLMNSFSTNKIENRTNKIFRQVEDVLQELKIIIDNQLNEIKSKLMIIAKEELKAGLDPIQPLSKLRDSIIAHRENFLSINNQKVYNFCIVMNNYHNETNRIEQQINEPLNIKKLEDDLIKQWNVSTQDIENLMRDMMKNINYRRDLTSIKKEEDLLVEL